MQINKSKTAACLLLGTSLASMSMPLYAADDVAALKARVERMERELAEMKALLKQQAENSARKAEVQSLKNEVAKNASHQLELDEAESVVHLAGYGQAGYIAPEGDSGSFNATFNPIFHYQYRDLLMFETELEFEFGTDGATTTAVEYAALDLFINDYMTFTAGKFLSPIGFFRRNLHPAWINKLPSKPVGFSAGQAAPVADIGAQLRGGFPLSIANNRYVNYALFVTNGPMLALDAAGTGIDSVDTESFVDDPDGNKLFGGRIGVIPFPGLELGVSGAYGDVAIDMSGEPDRGYHVLDFDANYQWRNLGLLAEYARQEVNGATASTAPNGQRWETYYVQAAYKWLPTKFETVIRYSDLNTSHADQNQEQWALGVNYLFAPNVIAKLAYEFNRGLKNAATDSDRVILQLGYGF